MPTIARTPSPQVTTPRTPAVLFDLDGTLIDSNYQHVAAWQFAFRRAGFDVPNAFLHRCIGMRGDLVIHAVLKETGKTRGERAGKRIGKRHQAYFAKTLREIRPLPGAVALLGALSRRKVPWAIATGGDKAAVSKVIGQLSVPPAVPIVTADDVDQAKPEPDVFLAAARRLHVNLSDCIVVGDSVWDLLAARRAKALGVGLLCGGTGAAELALAGAFRVYEHPGDLLDHLAEIGIDSRGRSP